MSTPTCEDCGRPADLAVKDTSRGYQASRQAPSPYRRICRPCLRRLQDAEAGDPWPRWADPIILATYTQEQTDMDAATLSEQLAPLAAELADIQERIADLAGQEALVKARIRELVDGPDKYDAGSLTVVVSANSRFDEKRALELLPDHVAPLVTYPQTRIDKDRLKVLAPDVYEAAVVTYDDKVGVR